MHNVLFKVVVLVCINVLVCIIDCLYSLHCIANWIIQNYCTSVHNGLFRYCTMGTVGVISGELLRRVRVSEDTGWTYG